MSTPTGTYTDVTWPSGTYTQFEWSFIPHTSPLTDGFFWSHQFGLDAGGGGYVGMQTRGSGLPGKCVVFSMAGRRISADGDPEVYEDVITATGTGIVTNDFDGGHGYSTRMTYNWVAGRTYRYKLARGGSDSEGRWWVAYITDTVTNTTTQIGSIKVPLTWGNLNPFSIFWTERYKIGRAHV